MISHGFYHLRTVIWTAILSILTIQSASQSLSQIEQEIDSLQSKLVSPAAVNRFLSLTDVMLDSGKYDRLIDWYLSALAASDSISYKKGRIQSRYRLMIEYYETFKYSESGEFANEILALTTSDREVMAMAYRSKGIAFSELEAYDSAITYYHKALSIMNEDQKTEQVYESLSFSYLKKGSHDDAINYALKALDLYTKANNKAGIFQMIRFLGIINKESGNLNDAMVYYQDGLNLLQNNRDSISHYKARRQSILVDIGLVYKADQKYDSAEYFMKRAYEVLDELQNYPFVKMNETRILTNLVDTYNLAGEHYKALTYAEKAESVEKENKLEKNKVLILEKGKALFHLGRISESKREFTALELMMGQTSLAADIIGELYTYLSLLAAEKNEYKKALEYYKKADIHNDSILTAEKTRIIANLNAKYETEKKEAALRQKQSEITLLKAKNKTANAQVFALALLSALVLVTGLLYYRQSKVKKKLTQAELNLAREKEDKLKTEIDYKNTELVNFALQISEKNGFLKELEYKVRALNNNSEADLKPLWQTIHSNRFLNKDREDFDKHVQQVCEGFFARLSTDYPGITRGEMKLAALIRMGLSSKEISSILNISSKSVDMNRYRLRKKMELDGSRNLTDELQSV